MTLTNADLTALTVQAVDLLDRCRTGGRAPRAIVEPFLRDVINLVEHARSMHATLTAVNELARHELQDTGRPAYAAAALRRALVDLAPPDTTPQPITRRRRGTRASA